MAERIEDKISKFLAEELKEKIGKLNKIEIGFREKVFIGTTCGFYKGDLRLLFQSAEQDIVIYLKEDTNNPKYFYNFKDKNSFFQRFPKSLTGTKNKSLPTGTILIPLVIFELKYKNVITHAIRQYSEIARMIKQVFPFCMYNLLLLNIPMNISNNVDRIYMAGKNFDKIIYKNDLVYPLSTDNPDTKNLINSMSEIIKTHIKYLENEDYYQLRELLNNNENKY